MYHLRAHVEIKRLLERAPHLLHGRFGVRSAGSRLRKKIADTLFLAIVPELTRCLSTDGVITRFVYMDGVQLSIISNLFAES